MSWADEPAGARRQGQEQLQLLAAGQGHRWAWGEVEAGADSKVFDHTGDADLSGRRLAHRPGREVRGWAGDAAGGELEFSRVHRQSQSRLLLDQGERAFDRADRTVEDVDDATAAGGRTSPEPLDRTKQGRVQGAVGGQQGRQDRGRAG